MKPKHRHYFSNQIMIVYLILIVFECSCKKFVQIGPPNTQIVTASVFNSSASATSAMLAIYIQMFNNSESFTMAQYQGLLGDELTNYSTFAQQIQLYTNSLQPIANNGEWDRGYNYIYEANAIIGGLQNNGQISASISRQLTGEAKFIRAFWHFYLTNMYGNIPIVTTTDYSVNKSLFRSSQAQVYAQITQDLKDAVSLLNGNYVDATDTAITNQRVRPTKGAAEALLARIYLYTGQYDSAEVEASNVINNNLYQLCSNLSPLMGANSVFLENSAEAIWQLSTPSPNLWNTIDGENFILQGAPSTNLTTSTAISPELYNSFEPGDKRKSNWVGTYITKNSPIDTFYYPYKYQNRTSTLTEFTMVLRLAEQYLIRAEAEAQQNNLTEAVKDLNTIRNRAGLANVSDSIASSKATILTAILHERQVELFTEWGHRWFDLIRTGSVNSVMGPPGNVCQDKGGIWNATDTLYPIPQSEILNDASLTQNPGY